MYQFVISMSLSQVLPHCQKSCIWMIKSQFQFKLSVFCKLLKFVSPQNFEVLLLHILNHMKQVRSTLILKFDFYSKFWSCPSHIICKVHIIQFGWCLLKGGTPNHGLYIRLWLHLKFTWVSFLLFLLPLLLVWYTIPHITVNDMTTFCGYDHNLVNFLTNLAITMNVL